MSTQKKVKKGSRKRRILVIGILCLAVLAVFSVLAYLDYSGSHTILRLGQYTGLSVTAADGKEPEDALIDEIVRRTRFGRAIKKKAGEKYEEAMKVFASDAEYRQMSLSEYIEKYYQKTEEEFREDVRKTAAETVRQDDVIRAIAEKENIVITDAEFDLVLPDIMEAYGYSDKTQFSQDVDFEMLRDELLQEKVIEYLLTRNTAQ